MTHSAQSSSASAAKRTLLCAVLCFACVAVGQDDSGAGAAAVLGPRREAKVFRAELAEAWQAYGRSNLETAEPLFRRVSEAPNAPRGEVCEALFGLGWCREFRRPLPDATGAVNIFARIAQEFASDPLAPWALIELGNLRVKKGQPRQEAGRKHYREVIEKYPDSPAVHEATLRLANSLLYEMTDAEMNEGAAVLERHLKQHPDNPLAVIMHFRLDYYYGDIRLDYAACLPHAIRVAELKLSDPFRWSRQYWHVAEILRLRLGRPVEAARWYRRIVEECPTSMQALASAELLAAIERAHPAMKGEE
jgi:tetratricopeptide (TPR) repeat protein